MTTRFSGVLTEPQMDVFLDLYPGAHIVAAGQDINGYGWWAFVEVE